MESYTRVGKALGEVFSAMTYGTPLERLNPADALGRVLAKDLVADTQSPEFDASHMDGFAVRSSDVGGKSSKLKLVGESNPESPARSKLGKGEAVRVSTGARLPEGADAVVPAEEAVDKSGIVVVGRKVGRWDFVYRAGTDFKKGEVLLKKGRMLRAQDLALLMTLGASEVEVRSIPTVAVLATGSELYEKGEEPAGRVLNTHGPLFANLAKSTGCSSVDLGVAPDDRMELSMRIARALEDSDLVLTLGGTSVGRRDLVGESVSSLAPQVLRHGLKMDRGRVSGVAVVKGKPLVMLPGPAQGAMNAFLLLAVPIIDRLQGKRGGSARVRAQLSKPWEARPRFKDFRKVVYVRLDGDGKVAEPLSGETESMTVLTGSSGYLVVEERTLSLRRGASVDVNLFPGQTSLW